MSATLVLSMFLVTFGASAIQGPMQPIPNWPKLQIIRPDIARLLPKQRSVMVYKVSPDRRWLDQNFRRAMEYFRVRSDLSPSQAQQGLLVAQSGSRYAEAYEASGGTFCADLDRLWPVVPLRKLGAINTRGLSREVTVEVAEQLVRRLGALPEEPVKSVYLPDEMEVQELGRPKLRGEGTIRAVVSASVLFRRMVDNLTVEGPGGKLKVYFGMEGEPVGLLRVMRVLKPYRRFKIRPALEVVQELQKTPVRRQLLMGVRRVEISRLKLVYYEAPATQAQKYLQPAYMATGVAYGRVGEHSFTVPYCEFVPALVKELEPLFEVGRRFKAAPRSSAKPRSPQLQDDE